MIPSSLGFGDRMTKLTGYGGRFGVSAFAM
jgi:hypothetical protein